MNLGDAGSVASFIGVVLAVAIAIYQRGETQAAQKKAEQERERAASLEDHLARQRWQQLKSLGEQIDSIEQNGNHKYDPMQAALHARLKEQYNGLLGIVATSTPNYSAATLRHWVTVGRLPRPWQIAEAISHLEKEDLSKNESDDELWLTELLKSKNVIPKIQAIRPPIELDAYTASFILISNSVRDQLKSLLSSGGQTENSATILLHYLALDCERLVDNTRIGPNYFKAWGTNTGKSFSERFNFYQSQDFWVIKTAADNVRKNLDQFRIFFEEGDLLHASLLPTQKSVDSARSRFPELVEAAAMIFQPRT